MSQPIGRTWLKLLCGGCQVSLSVSSQGRLQALLLVACPCSWTRRPKKTFKGKLNPQELGRSRFQATTEGVQCLYCNAPMSERNVTQMKKHFLHSKSHKFLKSSAALKLDSEQQDLSQALSSMIYKTAGIVAAADAAGHEPGPCMQINAIEHCGQSILIKFQTLQQ